MGNPISPGKLNEGVWDPITAENLDQGGNPISAGNIHAGDPISAENLDGGDPISAGNLDGGIPYLQQT